LQKPLCKVRFFNHEREGSSLEVESTEESTVAFNSFAGLLDT
jgi:hypothetical protein